MKVKSWPVHRGGTFLEADAYMGWSKLLELLSKFDPDKPWYLGATYIYGDVAFAHDGMDYIILNGAMRMLDTIWSPQSIARWERRTVAGCRGDVELAAVLQEAGVNITGIPGLYGESLSWFEWDEMESLWQYETQWFADNETHYVYRDLFHKLIKSHLASTRSDWDNMSRDRVYTGPSGLHGDEDRRYPLRRTWGNLSDEEKVEQLGQLDDDQKKDIESYGTFVKEMRWDDLSDEEKEEVCGELAEPESQAHTSLRTCRIACELSEQCVQYFFKPGWCHLHRTVRLGHYADPVDAYVDMGVDTQIGLHPGG
ncbi:hypothetical protein LTR49_028117 [Elasticomyces elasticus]|nr:hypothetical protein LTR49_028117 [Elasticomyces elasticus]